MIARSLLLAFATLAGCATENIVAECDPAAPYADKATCDDGDPATFDRCIETSLGPACVSIRATCDGFDPPAVQADRCDDGDPCTEDACEVTACVHVESTCP